MASTMEVGLGFRGFRGLVFRGLGLGLRGFPGFS